MNVYFVVEENISNTSLRGTQYLCKGGVRKTYGEFVLENGFTTLHKAELEAKKALQFYQTSTHLTAADVWKHRIEIRDIPVIKK